MTLHCCHFARRYARVEQSLDRTELRGPRGRTRYSNSTSNSTSTLLEVVYRYGYLTATHAAGILHGVAPVIKRGGLGCHSKVSLNT